MTRSSIVTGGAVSTGAVGSSPFVSARMDSADLTASTWSDIDVGATNISSTRDTVFFDFTPA